MNLDGFVLLFCNGEPPTRATLDRIIPHPSKIVCADGGANKALSVGYIPDIVVGDLDSVDRSDARLSGTRIVKVDSQESTDFEKTLDFVTESGWKKILVTAFGGGRIDHALANIQIAYKFSRSEGKTPSLPTDPHIILVDERFLVFPVTDIFSQEVSEGTTVSIVPMKDKSIVSTRGLAYELNYAHLPRGGHGISNRANAGKIEITVHRGGIMVFVAHT